MKTETINIGGTKLILETVHMPSFDWSLPIFRSGDYGELTCEIEKPDIQKGDEFELAGGRFVVTGIVARYERFVSIRATGKTRADFERVLENIG